MDNNQPAVGKQRHIVDTLRLEIVDGVHRPGTRLPPQSQLVDRFGVSAVTIQHALNQLIRDGFIYTKSRKGTFVATDPPHLNHYGLVFHTHPSDKALWPQFWVALSHEAVALQQTSGRDLSIFYGVNGRSQTGDYAKLDAMVKRHLLAGLIFMNQPDPLLGTALLDEPNIPRVAIMPQANLPGVTAVKLDNASLTSRILNLAAERRYKRAAFLVIPRTDRDYIAALMRGMQEIGTQVRPEWLQAVPVESGEWAKNIVHLLVSQEKSHRPDVLCVLDDNLVHHATAGLTAAGLRVPDDIEVIAHANFPWATPSAVQAHRVGYDVRQVLKACIDAIDNQRSGQEPAKQVDVTALWEHELEGNPAPAMY